MDCTRMEELLALFVGDDLDARQTERVRAHLVGCAACQARADELAASRAWLQAAPPPQFDEAFYAGLRQSVLRELALAENTGGRFDWLFAWRPQLRWQPVLALAATGLLLFVGWAAYRNVGSKSQDSLPAYAVATPSPAALPPDVRKVSDLPGQKLLPSGGYAPNRLGHSPVNSSARLPGGRRPPAHQAAEPQEAAPRENTGAALVAQVNGQNTRVAKPEPVTQPAVTRLEIQTADPNIRIIWLTPQPGAAPTTTEPQTR